MERAPKLTQGDMIAIHWLDIMSDSVGDMKDADTAYCVTLGFFHEWRGRGRNRKLVTGLTTFPKDKDEDPRGWDSYPYGCLVKLEVLHDKDHIPS